MTRVHGLGSLLKHEEVMGRKNHCRGFNSYGHNNSSYDGVVSLFSLFLGGAPLTETQHIQK